MGAVYVAGSLNMDVVAFSERLPLPGETRSGSKLGFFPGGKGLNSAVSAAKQGADVRMIGKLGADGFGDTLFEFLESSGVDGTLVSRSKDCATGTAIIMVAGDGENSIVVIPGTNGLVAPGEMRIDSFSGDDVFLTVLEIPGEACDAFLRHGRERGARTILAAAPAAKIGFLGVPDILIVNEGEAGFYAGAAPPAGPVEAISLARALRHHDTQTVIITLGTEGAVASSPEGDLHIPARKVDAVDATGAGDCFAGCVAARVAAGDSLEASMRYAGAAASICVTRPGAAPSMPSRAEVEPLLG